jgi:small subunit ribosomal protein S17
MTDAAATNETDRPGEVETAKRGFRKVRVGMVVSDKMDKTVIVQVSGLKSHPLYKKVIRQRERFKAHDENNECGIGDRVRIMETRPISRDKRWRIVEILEKAK